MNPVQNPLRNFLFRFDHSIGLLVLISTISEKQSHSNLEFFMVGGGVHCPVSNLDSNLEFFLGVHHQAMISNLDPS